MSSIRQNGFTFILTTTLNKQKLPQTGVLWWPVPILAAAGLAFLIAGTLSRKKKAMSKRGKICTGIGLLLLAAALSLTAYNLWSDAMAGASAKAVLEQLKPAMPDTQTRSETQEHTSTSLPALPSGESPEEAHIPDYILNPEEVAALEVLSPFDVEEMTTGDWDLTLFTCTVGGQSRIAVRCESVQNSAQ